MRPKRDDGSVGARARNERGAIRTKRNSIAPTNATRDKKGAWTDCTKLAEGQNGVVTCAQLLDAGIDRDRIKRWTRAGYLHRVHQGIYVVGHLALAPLAAERAALMACGPHALLSHATAAWLWGVLDDQPKLVDLTVVGRRCRAKMGLRIHGVARLDQRDIRRREGLWLTAPARTVVDLAARVTMHELERLVAELRIRRLIRDGELEAALERTGSPAGSARMRAFLEAEGEPDITRSAAERRLRRLLRDAQLPQPRANARVAGYEVDFLWEEEKVIVELDGFQFHGHRRAFERDRRKDRVLADAGFQVIRITWRQLIGEPLAIVAHIARALDRRRQEAH